MRGFRRLGRQALFSGSRRQQVTLFGALLVAGSLTATSPWVSQAAASPGTAGVAGSTSTEPVVPTTVLGLQTPRPVPAPARAQAGTSTTVDCPSPTAKQEAVCVTINSQHPSPPTRTTLPTRTTSGLQPPPDWCYDNAYKGWLITRTEACQILDATIQIQKLQNGVIVADGTLRTNVIQFAFTSTSLLTFDQQVSFAPYASTGNVAGLTVTGSGECPSGCVVASTDYPTQSMAVNALPAGYVTYTGTAASGAKLNTSPNLWALFSRPGAIQSAVFYAPPTVRCDNAMPGAPSSVGCVFSDFLPVMIYSLTGPYPELARHIQAAQNSGLPGAYPDGTPLKRLFDRTLQDKNRNKACPSSLPSIPNKQCDEYPYASTYQGASTGGSGTARTFSWCSLPSTPTGVTGPSGWSRCMIDAMQNEVGGSELGSFFLSDRVLKDDLYQTWIAP